MFTLFVLPQDLEYRRDSFGRNVMNVQEMFLTVLRTLPPVDENVRFSIRFYQQDGSEWGLDDDYTFDCLPAIEWKRGDMINLAISKAYWDALKKGKSIGRANLSRIDILLQNKVVS